MVLICAFGALIDSEANALYEIIMDFSKYSDNIPGLISLIAGCVLSTALFVFLINPLHNFIQYFVASKCGDVNVEAEGFMTMSVYNSFHSIGAVSALVLNMGFSSQIIHDRERFRRPILGTVLMALSGILTYALSSMILLFIYALLTGFRIFDIASATALPVDGSFFVYVYHALYSALYFLVRTCLYSAVLNLIPLIPLDMGDVLYMFFNTRTYDALCNNEMLVSTGILAVAFFTFGKPGGFISSLSSSVLQPVLQFFLSIIT